VLIFVQVHDVGQVLATACATPEQQLQVASPLHIMQLACQTACRHMAFMTHLPRLFGCPLQVRLLGRCHTAPGPRHLPAPGEGPPGTLVRACCVYTHPPTMRATCMWLAVFWQSLSVSGALPGMCKGGVRQPATCSWLHSSLPLRHCLGCMASTSCTQRCSHTLNVCCRTASSWLARSTTWACSRCQVSMLSL
jgi:hypothetical protein